jgi:hypothetical protein
MIAGFVYSSGGFGITSLQGQAFLVGHSDFAVPAALQILLALVLVPVALGSVSGLLLQRRGLPIWLTGAWPIAVLTLRLLLDDMGAHWVGQALPGLLTALVAEVVLAVFAAWKGPEKLLPLSNHMGR